MPKPLSETRTLSEATTSSTGGLLEVEFMTPGWGSSGYYSPEVVEAAVPLFAAGTHMYLDHPTAAEDEARPVRSVKDLAGVLVEAGTLNPATGGVVGKVKPFGPYRDLLLDEDFAKNIGLSIRGSASDLVVGEAEGRRGPIVESLVDIASVDFVTRAGRGGRVLAVLESAGAADRAVARGVAETTANDTRDALQTLLRDSHGGEKTWVYVRDFDDTTVWFEVDGSDGGLFAQTYIGAGATVALTGGRTEVRVVTTYVPVNPAGHTTTESLKEDTMPQIEESELARLREAHGRVPTLESERDTAIRERDEAVAERDRLATQEAARTRADRAVELIRTNEARTNAGVEFSALEARGLTAALPLTEAGALDEAAFTTAVTEAVTERLAGTGGITGFGGSQPIAEADFKAFEADFFGTKEA